MFSHLRLHVWAHLKFFLRNRLVLGLMLVAAAFWAMGFIPFLMWESAGGRFERLRYLSTQMHELVWFYGALLALIAMSAHLRDRSTRLVFTRATRPEVWIVSVFASALLVAVVAHGLTAAATFTLSLAWGIPYQVGFVWLALDAMVESAVVIALLGALAVGIHPIIAVTVMFLFSDSIMYYFYSLLAGANQAGSLGGWGTAGTWITRGLYTVMPMFDPFHTETSGVNASLRVAGSDWAYLAATAAYAALVASFCFFFATFTLRRRTL
jgi:hypothetical protein